MRFKAPLFAFLLVAGSLTLPLVAQAGVPFFGPIIDNTCPLGWGAVMTVINNIISLLITLAIVFVAPLMIAWAGFLFVTNPVKPSGKEEAKKILTNTVVGIVIALAGYMIVATIMAVLYNPEAKSGKTTLGNWFDIVGSQGEPFCLPQTGIGTGLDQATQGSKTPGVNTVGLPILPPPDTSGAACNPVLVQEAAKTGGYDIDITQARILACIAKPESSCGSNHVNYAWNTGVPGKPGSTAYGAFQVLLKTNSRCYENEACYKAANVTGPLNCDKGFSNGNPIPNSEIAQQCVNAASNLNCSASAAACLLKENGGDFKPWQKDKNSVIQTACINSGNISS